MRIGARSLTLSYPCLLMMNALKEAHILEVAFGFTTRHHFSRSGTRRDYFEESDAGFAAATAAGP